jgi:integrase/recombinase XerD
MAEHLQPEVLRAHDAGRGSTRRLEVLAGAWLSGYHSASTRRAYRHDLRTWFRFCAEHEVDPLSARRSHVELFTRGQEYNGLAPATVARRITALSSWYTWLVDGGYVPTDPVARVRRPHVSSESTRPWLSRVELAAWLDTAEALGGYDYALACLLAINDCESARHVPPTSATSAPTAHHRTLGILGHVTGSLALPAPSHGAYSYEPRPDTSTL